MFRPLCFPMVLLLAPSVTAEEVEYPEILEFANRITDVVWDLRGTNNLKHLRFDGESIHSLTPSGEPHSDYDFAFLDSRFFRLEFSGRHNGWYFFSDDLKWMTPTNVSVEVRFVPADGREAVPIRSFPEDLTGLVWQTDPEDNRLEAKFRWTGEVLEFGAKQPDGEWAMEKHPYLSAGLRRIEVEDDQGNRVWFAFTEDGSECWFLQVDRVFGGHKQVIPRRAKAEAREQRLTPQHNDLANHAQDLLSAGETEMVATIFRELEKALPDYRNGHEEQLERLRRRLEQE